MSEPLDAGEFTRRAACQAIDEVKRLKAENERLKAFLRAVVRTLDVAHTDECSDGWGWCRCNVAVLLRNCDKASRRPA
jgi:hypothetical protein